MGDDFGRKMFRTSQNVELVVSRKAKGRRGFNSDRKDQPSLTITKLFPILPRVKHNLIFNLTLKY